MIFLKILGIKVFFQKPEVKFELINFFFSYLKFFLLTVISVKNKTKQIVPSFINTWQVQD